MTVERITLNVFPDTLNKARLLMDQLSVNSLDQLFDQMVEELDWQCNYSSPVKAALLASRAISKAAESGKDSQGDSPRTGEQPA